jgi:uncharacterized protein HemY
MDDFRLAGKLLLIIGAIFVLAGIIILFGHKIPYIGRLPGDIIIHRKNFTFYFPITTLIILNVIILLIIYLFKR